MSSRGMYSEPLMHINLFIEWRNLLKTHVNNLQPLYDYCRRLGLAYTRVKSFYSSTSHLLSRVNESLGYRTHTHSVHHTTTNNHSSKQALSFDHLHSLSVSKQNMLRLILLWSSEDNILSAKPLQLKSNTTLYTAQFDVPLSKEHLNPLFPVDVEWKLDGCMRKIYDAKFNHNEPRNNKLLLTTILQYSHAPVVWIIVQAKDVVTRNLINIISIAILSSESILKRDTEEMKEYFTFVSSFTNNFLQKKECKMIKVPQQIIINLNDDDTTTTPTSTTSNSKTTSTKTASILDKDTYDIYLLQHPSKNDLRWWADAHKDLNKSISLYIPLDTDSGGEHAKLTDNNCFLTTAQVQNIFFGDSFNPSLLNESTSTTSTTATTSATTSAANASGKNNNKSSAVEQSSTAASTSNNKNAKLYHISEQIISASQNKLVFPNPLKDTNTNAYDRKRSNKTASGKLPDDKEPVNKDITPRTHQLITDIPIGLRLINAYKSMYKDKKLRLWKTPRITKAPPAFEYDDSKDGNYGNNRNKTATSTTTTTAGASAHVSNRFIPTQLLKANLSSGKVSVYPSATNSNTATPSSTSAASNSTSASTSTAIVPGSAEWLKNKNNSKTNDKTNETSASSSYSNATSTEEDKLMITLKSVSTSWINLNGFGRMNSLAKPPMALLAKQSHISVAVHCGAGALFGVAYNTTTLG